MTVEPRIRQVKREIRTLGVVAKRYKDGGSLIIGVVFRGGLYLDGVLKATTHDPDITNTMVEMIKSSPHYPQIRVLILHEALIDEEVRIDPSQLYNEVKRPLILLSDGDFEGEHRPPINVLEVELGGKTVKVIPLGLRGREAEKILMVTTRDGALPEPIRVADLISSALICLDEQKI
ncbi:MAG: DUF99 family protein [Candidatus Bathyarchaeia archaeon]|nr:DUF99 family protein [Candidatus Bathyarchaeota archaeon]